MAQQLTLFKTIDELRDFVGGGANLSVDVALLAPVSVDAAERFIVPFLGSEEFALLLEEYQADALRPEREALLPHVQRALANLTIYEASKVWTVQFSNAGILRSESDGNGMKTAFRYQESEFRAAHLAAGLEALETLLLFLEKNRADYQLWADSDEGLRHRSLFLNTARDFRNHYDFGIDAQHFQTLRPIIREAQKAMEFWLPKALFADWQAKLLAGTFGQTITPTANAEKTAKLFLQGALANLAVSLAVRRQMVQLARGRVLTIETLLEQSAFSEKQGSGWPAYEKIAAHSFAADRFCIALRCFLEENVADFALAFDEKSGGTNTDGDAWKTAAQSAIEALADPKPDPRAGRGVFGL